MITTDFNEMQMNILQIICDNTGIELEINDGKIVGTVEKKVSEKRG